MKTCSTCQHWSAQRQTHGHCSSDKVQGVSAIRKSVHKRDTLRMIVHSGHATLTTGPEFGCVHHQGREAA